MKHSLKFNVKKVDVFQSLLVVGFTSDRADSTTSYGVRCDVITIDAGALFQASYPSYDGLSVIVSVDTDGFHVVGVHIGTHNDTKSKVPTCYG